MDPMVALVASIVGGSTLIGLCIVVAAESVAKAIRSIPHREAEKSE